MVIVAGALLASADSQDDTTLIHVADAVSSDLAYARSLAVSRNSKYTLTFDLTNHTYTLTHSGTSTALNTLPASPTGVPSSSGTSQVTSLRKLPGSTSSLGFARVLTRSGMVAGNVTTVEFNPLGNTTATNQTEIWLAAGASGKRTYLGITVNPTTGIADVGDPTGTAP